MKVLFHLAHPAHFHLFKNVIRKLKDNNHSVSILIKKKDVLEELLKESGFEYHNILPKGRKDDKLSIAFGLFAQISKIFFFCLKNRPNILIGTSAPISHVGKLLFIPAINANEDDADVVPLYAKLAYPWAKYILAPSICSVGKWSEKKIGYESYHELAYLHPSNFTPDIGIASKYVDTSKPFSILRFVKLGAHHDVGITGISDEIAQKLVDILKLKGNVYITSERKLNNQLEPFRIQIKPTDMHHVMAFANLFVGDSQTMAAEAGVLGTPFIRFNDFVGRIGYLKDLEDKYELGFGIRTASVEHLYKKVEELINTKELREIYKERQTKMLREKIDLASFIYWFIINYPQSAIDFKRNPEIQFKINN